MDFELVVIRGRSTNQALKLSHGITTVGRHDGCQLRIKASQVSRRHCELVEKGGVLLVRDLGSSNGTYVNGRRIQGRRVLEPGDEIMIGQVKLRVAKVGQTPPPPAPPKWSKPGDTVIAEPVPDGREEEFEIEFDGESMPAAPKAEAAPPPAPPKAKAAAPDEDAIVDFLLDFKIDNEDEPVLAAKPKSKSDPAPMPVPAPEPHGSDDAIAEFLLDIKLDEDDE